MATREVPREKNMGLKSTLVNVKYSKERYDEETLREKCPNTEFLLVRIFPHSDGIRRDTVFSPNAGKDRPEETPYLNTFHAVRGFSIRTY